MLGTIIFRTLSMPAGQQASQGKGIEVRGLFHNSLNLVQARQPILWYPNPRHSIVHAPMLSKMYHTNPSTPSS